MAKNYRDNNRKQFSTETVHLGTFLHPAGDQLILKLECRDIPYPNSSVLFNKRQIGKVDEVFGPVDDVYAAVKLDAGQNVGAFRLEAKFEAYKDKFIFRDRFSSREEVEKKKLQNDKKKASSDAKSAKNSYNKSSGFRNNGKGGYNKKGDFNKSPGNFENKKGKDSGRGSYKKDFNSRGPAKNKQ